MRSFEPRVRRARHDPGHDYHPRVLRPRIRSARRRRLPVVALATVAASLGAGAVVASPGAAAAEQTVAVIVVPTLTVSEYANRGAIGLFVPGAGSTVTRERALASLVRGRVVSSLVGLDGDPVLRLAEQPARTTIYLVLPPAGSHHNVVRYPVAIVGPGYHGLLRSTSTRIDGLVSLADIAPTASAIARGEAPPIRAVADASAVATLRRLDAGLAHAHDARTGATLVLVGWLVLFAALGVLGHSPLAGRAAVLVAPVALGTALSLRAVGVEGPETVVAALAALTGGISVLLALRRAAFVPSVVGFLLAFLVVLAVWPEVNALAAIGPHPDGGGRFYGVTNQVETLLLAPSLAAGALAGVMGAAAIGLLLLVTVGWSRAGADGGGVLVVAASFAVLLAGLGRIEPRPGGSPSGSSSSRRSVSPSSEPTRSSEGRATSPMPWVVGPARCSTISTGASGSRGPERPPRRTPASCVLSLVGLTWLGVRGRHEPVIRAMLVAIGISLVVNDTPVDVLGYGALGCLALTAWDETRVADVLSARSAARNRLRALPGRPPH